MSAPRKALAVVALTAATLGIVPVAHAAGRGPGGGSQGGQNPSGGKPSGEKDGQYIGAKISFDESKNGSGNNVGPVRPVGDWTPPACWYAPKYTPAEYRAYREDLWSVGGDGVEWVQKEKKKFVEGHPYKNFNMDQTGKGYWWGGFMAPGRHDEAAAWECMLGDEFWVKKGQTPKVDHVISPEILAALAYEKIRVPNTDVTLSPAADAKQTVNLSTWVWSGKADFKPVSVTASLDALGMSATTTATPVALRIDAGTPDATLFPTSGECPIGPDGTIGVAYSDDKAHQNPPCGLTYLRASGDGPYRFTASITWKIHWTGTGVPGGDLPEGTFEQTTDLTVQEVQSVVRSATN